MKKIKSLFKNIKKINKKTTGLIAVGVVLIVILIIVIGKVSLNTNANGTITCKKNYNPINGFTINDVTTFKIRRNKIININIDKSISMDKKYSIFDTYYTILEKSFKSAYNYVDDKNLSIEKTQDGIKANVIVNEKDNGVIIDNINISFNNDNDEYDINFNSLNNFDSSSSTYKINDEYKVNELKNKIKELGYTCE